MTSGRDGRASRDGCGEPQLIFHADVGELAERVADLVTEAILERIDAPRSPWLNLVDAAAHLACSPERLRKLVQRRSIPFHQERAGGRIFFNRAEIDDWMSAR